MHPLISVIIPAFNAQATLRHAAASALSQSVRDIQLIIVDDGSTDSTAAVARDLARQDARVMLVHQSNAGLAAARNTGISAARAPFIAFLDADDRFLPGGLESMLTTCRAHPGDAAFGGFELVSDSGESIACERSALPLLTLNDWLSMPFVIVSSMLLPRDALKAERFDVTCTRVEDYDLWFRLAQRGLRWHNARADICVYEVRPGTMSTDFASMFRHSQAVITRAFDAARTFGQSIDTSDARRDLTLASSAMAWATRAALVHGPNHGLAILRAAPPSTPIDPERAAGHALSAICMGLAMPARVGPGKPPIWLAPLMTWWNTIERAHFTTITAGFAAALLRALAERLIDPEEIAIDLLKSLPWGARSITILGDRANAHRLRAAAESRSFDTQIIPSPAAFTQPNQARVLILTNSDRTPWQASMNAHQSAGGIILDWYTHRRHMAQSIAGLLRGWAENSREVITAVA